MNRCFIFIGLFLYTFNSFAQFGYSGLESSRTDFVMLLNAFLQSPTNKSSNEEIFRKLEYLQDDIKQANVSQEERTRLNELTKDIEVVKEFMAPISNRYNSHLKGWQLDRLQELFGHNFIKTKLLVKCPSDEVEFIEIKLNSLRICYFHNVSHKTKKGLRIKFYAVSGNANSRGEYGALYNEYTQVLNNVGNKYLKIIFASIIERF